MFKVGDKVFHLQHGWGEVTIIDTEESYPITVCFNNSGMYRFTKEGCVNSRDKTPTLSFTEYTLQGFSQEMQRPLGVPKPLKIENVDIKKLWNTCEDFISFLESDEYHEDKIENYVNDVFGKAMSAIYGKDIFIYINSKIE